MHRIGPFSKLGRVAVKTLHHCDEVGLLTPAYVDEPSGSRYYATSQLSQLSKIVALRQMGFSISEISVIVADQDFTEILTSRKTELEAEVRNVTSQLFQLNHYINEQKRDPLMNYQAGIKQIPAYTGYSARHTLPNYAALNDIMPTLGQKVSAANPGIKCVEPDYCFNMYLDSKYRETDINVEICQVVANPGKDSDGITFKDIPAITAIFVLHKGSYQTLGEAYAYAMQWTEQRGPVTRCGWLLSSRRKMHSQIFHYRVDIDNRRGVHHQVVGQSFRP